MTDLLLDLLGYATWAAIVGVVLWWVWSMRKASEPRKRTPREDAELTGLRDAIERSQRSPEAPPRR